MAKAGFTGAPALTLQTKHWHDLGENWLITKQYFKPYPVCRWAQAPIAAVLDLKQTYDFSSTDVASVHITSFYEAVRLGQKKVTNTEEAQYSTSFPCAIALVHGDILPEHIADDAVILTSLKNKLAPGGRIVLKIPAIPRLFNSLDAAVGHFRRYDQNTLTLAAHSAGCTVRYCRSFNIVGIPGWWWNGVRQRVVAPGAQIGGFDKLVPILAFGEKFLPPMAGLSLIGGLEGERQSTKAQTSEPRY